tara:strand:+ start:8403 stop:8576 length:174 start_codon:yes stop_codon:yes gene_type:complete
MKQKGMQKNKHKKKRNKKTIQRQNDNQSCLHHAYMAPFKQKVNHSSTSIKNAYTTEN